jgi:hypothetical protein
MQSSNAPVAIQANLMLVGALVLGLILAVFLGSSIGSSEMRPLMLVGLVCLALLFAMTLHRYVWQIGLFLLYLGFSYRPTTFAFGAVELSCALGFAVIGLFVWQRKRFERPAILQSGAFRFVEATLFIWLVYVALHFIWNVRDPVRPSEFALTNAVKSYFAMTAPLLLLFYFGRNPAGILVRGDFFVTICRIALLALIVNLGIRAYEIAGGFLYLPYLNAMPSIHTLRGIGPLAMLLGAVGLTEVKRAKSPGLGRTLTFFALISLGTIGALFSGGRATLVIGLMMIAGVFFFRRKVMALAGVVMLAIATFAIANLFADYINTRANPFVQRSVQWLLFQKNWDTVRTMESSTDWRTELARRAIDEWRSDARIFWTGRATYGFGAADERAIFIAGGFEALIQTSLRRGATHNLVTDLLVAYGIIGCVLYLAMYVALIRFGWVLYKRRDLSSPATNLALVCFVGALFSLAYALTIGGAFPADYVWYFVIMIAAMYSGIVFDADWRASRALPSNGSATNRAGSSSASAELWRPPLPQTVAQQRRFKPVARR